MADDEPEMEMRATCTAEELAAQRYEAAKAKGEVVELSDDDDEPAKPHTPLKQTPRSRLDDVSFGNDGRTKDTSPPSQLARKRRQIVISDGEEDSEEEDVVLVTPPPRKKHRATPSPGVTVSDLKDRCRSRGLKVGGTKSELLSRLANPSAVDRVGYRASRPLKANARSQYFVNGQRVSKSQFDRCQGGGGFRAAQAQHRAAEAQCRAMERQANAMARMFPW